MREDKIYYKLYEKKSVGGNKNSIELKSELIFENVKDYKGL